MDGIKAILFFKNKYLKKMLNDMNPVSWTKQKRGFYMSKLSYEDKIEIYEQLISPYGEKFTKEEAQYAIDHLDE